MAIVLEPVHFLELLARERGVLNLLTNFVIMVAHIPPHLPSLTR